MTLSMSGSAKPAWTRRWLPTTKLGRVACWFALGFLAWLLIVNPIVMMMNRPEGLPIAEPFRTLAIILALTGFASGLVGAVLSLIAIVRSRERSIAAFAVLAPGVFVIVFLLGELLVPH